MRYCGWLAALLATALLAGGLAAPAQSESKLLVGFGDHWLLERPSAAVTVARDLGATAFRVPFYWQPGENKVAGRDADIFDTAVAAAFGMRIVVIVTGTSARRAPSTASARNSYCSYVRSFLDRYPSVNDIVIWNEPNKSADWQPQFTRTGASLAPAAYEALLARCWDVLHDFRPEVNVLAPATSPTGNDNPRAVSNISHSPGKFIAGIGAAYRRSNRRDPIFDNVAHHMYGATPAERPWRRHVSGPVIAQGDWGKLVKAFKTAFAGTDQPVPGRCVGERCALIWYMEAGYQTAIPAAKRRLYRFKENIGLVIPAAVGGESDASPPATSRAPDQATQVVDGIRLAYCQPYVAAFFNYLLRDDADLRGWQSGAVWRDAKPKPSYKAFQRAIAEASDEEVDCSALKGGPLPQP